MVTIGAIELSIAVRTLLASTEAASSIQQVPTSSSRRDDINNNHELVVRDRCKESTAWGMLLSNPTRTELYGWLLKLSGGNRELVFKSRCQWTEEPAEQEEEH